MIPLGLTKRGSFFVGRNRLGRGIWVCTELMTHNGRDVLVLDTEGIDALDAEFKAAGKTCAVADCFDLIAGTSSGSFVAAALALPRPDGGRGPAPAEIVRFFEDTSRRIFPSRWFCNIPILGRLPQLFGPLHDAGRLAAVLEEQFGDVVFASARRNLLIPAYSIDPRDIILFRGGPHYKDMEECDCYQMISVRDAMMASSAAPTASPRLLVNDSRSHSLDSTQTTAGAAPKTHCTMAGDASANALTYA